MNEIPQFFIDEEGYQCRFIDKRQFIHSQKVKASDIVIIDQMDSSATPQDIADEINKHTALAAGKIVGYLK